AGERRIVADSAPVLMPELADAVGEAERIWLHRQQELEHLLEANETILVSLPDALVLVDGQGRIVRANPAAEDLFGGALAGRDLIGVLRDPSVIDAVRAARPGLPGRVLEISLPVPVQRVLSARVQPLAATSAEETTALITFHDITRIKRSEQMRADFVANASHEL